MLFNYHSICNILVSYIILIIILLKVYLAFLFNSEIHLLYLHIWLAFNSFKIINWIFYKCCICFCFVFTSAELYLFNNNSQKCYFWDKMYRQLHGPEQLHPFVCAPAEFFIQHHITSENMLIRFWFVWCIC